MKEQERRKMMEKEPFVGPLIRVRDLDVVVMGVLSPLGKTIFGVDGKRKGRVLALYHELTRAKHHLREVRDVEFALQTVVSS